MAFPIHSPSTIYGHTRTGCYYYPGRDRDGTIANERLPSLQPQELSDEEEQIVRYVAGFVPMSLLKKHEKKNF